jgi:hypothetical protein
MMKKQKEKLDPLWYVAGFIALLIALICMCDDTHATDFSFSWYGTEGPVSFGVYQECDSGRACFGYPSISNFYEKVKLLPVISGDKYTLKGDRPELDSVGLHAVRIWYWPLGSTDSTYVDAYQENDRWAPVNHFPSTGSADLATLFVVYYRNGAPQKGASLIAANDNIVYDSADGIVMGPIYQADLTDGNGVASVVLPKSYLFNDSLGAGYDVKLRYAGRIVRAWSDLWMPNQDTLRLRISE